MPLSIVNVAQVANKVSRPFATMAVANVGDLVVNVFICQGTVQYHRHFDEDELFLVHEGVVALETVRGTIALHPEELAVVPKGVGHRSKSNLRSVVVLIRPAVMTERKNGHRQVTPLETDPPLEKVRLNRAAEALIEPQQAVAVAQVEDFEVLLRRAEGPGPNESAPLSGAFWLAVRGAVKIELSGEEAAPLAAGELTVIPAGTGFRLNAVEPSLLLTLARTP